ncbi:DUF1850 domain-containing protein [Brachyspira hyodysenteriae]|uniref:DUF1850 domain-containing protein n=1 Tax=Brachyspira hyodysenteriae TaxID=159 RepID=UPI0022CDB67B|nr:DUF1850 domain-containing protein [Brachyspira hyodysenteriae]MCZ9928276.1 DUF1850 domain-containing protein [Brachyspira hyodysenteriae]WPC25306.1 DUF1850 domain-containing protein [Brachyspira hyodysenteriae]WPC37404.1 DUF1850 domain-containing protein [Brachyspira hyodysenteriae]
MLKKVIICISVIVVIIALLFIPLFPRLVLNSVKNNKVNFIFNINKKEFLISYTHSVNKGRIRDYYIINTNNDIVLDKTRFVSYGAGMSDPQNDENIIITDDYIEINNIKKQIKDLYLFVGIVADHRIELDGNEIKLNTLFEPQVNIKIQYKRVSLFTIIINIINNKILRGNNET